MVQNVIGDDFGMVGKKLAWSFGSSSMSAEFSYEGSSTLFGRLIYWYAYIYKAILGLVIFIKHWDILFKGHLNAICS